MSPELIGVMTTMMALNIAILGMLFKVMVDMGNLRERMARIEGLFEGFTSRSARGDMTPPAASRPITAA